MIPGGGEGDTSLWLIGRGTVRRRDVGSQLGTSWTARSLTSFTNAVLLPRGRREALLGEGVLSGLGYDLSFFSSFFFTLFIFFSFLLIFLPLYSFCFHFFSLFDFLIYFLWFFFPSL